MKRKIFIFVNIIMSVLITCTVFFVGCSGDKGSTSSVYSIQYTDDAGTHSINVTMNMHYSLDKIPTRNGYDFMGLYDKEVGGIKYVSNAGTSLLPFTDEKNIVLYPQFKAKEYTVVLDYQEAAVSGNRQIVVTYDSNITGFPENPNIEHKDFLGWFTEANCKGVQIADEYGSIPIVSVLNDTNFDLSSGSVTLYAGFETEKHNITFYFKDGIETENIEVEYDTPISQVLPKTRVDGQAPLTWSKTKNGNAWNGKVTEDMTLYAIEYAPFIELDLNDGTEIKEIVARVGSVISLPTPQKPLSEFMYYVDEDGEQFNSRVMPDESIKLFAVWRNRIVFDSNGGSAVEDIVGLAGDNLILPEPVRTGYAFAGWYTDNKLKYNNILMPNESICLKAGWYKESTYTATVVGSSNIRLNAGGIGTTHEKSYVFDLFELLGINFQEAPENVQLKLSFKSKHNKVGNGNIFNPKDVYAGINCYIMGAETQSNNSTYYSQSFGSNAIINSYQNRELKTKFKLSSRYLYVLFKVYKEYNSELANPAVDIKDATLVISYPDTSKLYL